MKKFLYNNFPLCLLLTVISCVSFVGCKKNKLSSAYASLLQHSWSLESVSSRNTIIGSFTGSWQTIQFGPGFYSQFNADGSWTTTTASGSVTEGTYYFLSDSIIITHNSPTNNIPLPQNHDTSFIRFISDSVYISYSRKYYFSPVYSTLDESLHTFSR